VILTLILAIVTTKNVGFIFTEFLCYWNAFYGLVVVVLFLYFYFRPSFVAIRLLVLVVVELMAPFALKLALQIWLLT